MADPLIEVRHLAVRYPGHTALAVEHLEVRPHETLAIIGPNGSGKSTLLRVLALLERPGGGEVRAFGRLVDGSRGGLALRRRIATVFQAPLLTDATVRDNVGLGLRFRGVPAAAAREQVDEWLARFGIGHLAGRHARTLSGGEAQRTSLARAFALRPEVLFLDEPFAALDPPTRDALLLDLEAVLHDGGTTTVFVTHDRNEALTVAGRVGVMIGGRLAQVAAPREVFDTPATAAVARFVGIENILEGRSAGQAVEVAGHAIRTCGGLPAGRAVTICIRAERVSLAGSPPPERAGRTVLPATITRVVPLGGHLQVHLDAGFPLRAALPGPAAGGLPLEAGRAVLAAVPAEAVHVIESGIGGREHGFGGPGGTADA